MKYIEEYKVFESNDNDSEILLDIKDILMEFSDRGYDVKV